MKIIITERQYSLYLKRRYHCMREYVDHLKSGREKLPVPSTSFEWDTYKYVIVAFLRGHCSKDFTQMFDEEFRSDRPCNFSSDLLYFV